MKKVVAFLLALIIFVAPITTLVKADVVIGDNDDTIINENATILGRKLALMESLSDLALSGVTEFTISNTNDVDSYLDYLWGEIDDAIESLSDGTGFTEISNSLKSKYFTNLVQYKDYITNRGNYLAQLLPNGSPTTTLLSTFFADNIYGKQTTQHYDLTLDMLRSLSDYRSQGPQPQPPLDFSDICNNLSNYPIGSYSQGYSTYDGFTIPIASYYNGNRSWNDRELYSYVQLSNYVTWNRTGGNNCRVRASQPITILVTGNDNDGWTATGNIAYTPKPFRISNSYGNYAEYFCEDGEYWLSNNSSNTNVNLLPYSANSITLMMNYLNQRFRHIDLYVNGELWVKGFSDSIVSPTLDIDGFLKIYGNNEPQQYELQPNTKIDYDQLYQVIYNAIRDNLPISQSDINYYDSHDTIYSPTIINNYGEEDGDENDLIDTILDYAVIPKFDTAIAQPMRAALTNGVVIMQNSITNVIPDEILLILGACFFLLLFAVVINRMIK